MTCPNAQVTGPEKNLEPDFQLQAGLFSGRAGHETGKSICRVYNSRALFSFYCYCLASIAFYKGRTLCLKTSEDLYG